jgi:hypothetical protein
MTAIDRFVDVFVDALRDDNAAVFAGAGLSIPAGLVDWAALMRDIGQDVGLDVDKEHDLLGVAQFHVNELGGRHRINQALISEFASRAATTENHRLLASLPIRSFWTTNYDALLEESLRNAQKRVDVKTTEASLALTMPRRDVVVYKMHGDIAQVDSAVVTRDDYEAYSTSHPLFGTALQGDLVSKTFLFIGFSFNDPNLTYLLSRIRLLLGQNRRDHYCLLRCVQRGDFSTDADYDYARAKQDLQVRDLRRYGIHGLLVDSYAEYTAVLRQVATRFRRRRVFVSGSAAVYTPFSESDGQEILRLLGRRLIEEGFDVVSGFGLGVGPYLLNGCLEGLAADGTSAIHDRLTLRPFPQGIADAAERADRWRDYRRRMIATAGIGVYVFGNRLSSGGGVEVATGVIEEFELAVADHLPAVAVGATGFAAAELHDRTIADFDRFYPGHPTWRDGVVGLADVDTPANLVNRIIAVVRTLSRGL